MKMNVSARAEMNAMRNSISSNVEARAKQLAEAEAEAERPRVPLAPPPCITSVETPKGFFLGATASHGVSGMSDEEVWALSKKDENVTAGPMVKKKVELQSADEDDEDDSASSETKADAEASMIEFRATIEGNVSERAKMNERQSHLDRLRCDIQANHEARVEEERLIEEERLVGLDAIDEEPSAEVPISEPQAQA